MNQNKSTSKKENFSIKENINKLSNFEFYKNKSLQNKIKNILKEKPDNDDTNSFSSSNIGSLNSKAKYHLSLNINQTIKNMHYNYIQ